MSSSHSSWLTPASALCSRHRFWRKEVTPAQGLLCQPPWQAQTPESRGLHGARGSDATTLRLWVSQEESVLLQRGCSWLQGSRPAPCPEPTAKRQQEMLSFCIHCLLFTLLSLPPVFECGPTSLRSHCPFNEAMLFLTLLERVKRTCEAERTRQGVKYSRPNWTWLRG